MPRKTIDLTTEEQEAYDRVNRLIDKHIYSKMYKEEVMTSIDNLVELLLKGDRE